ncbi:DUF7260 family protein [Halopiger xanaduensis]|uniref:DUF7260 domain-containing protein n=1 Tax=Halopiger xanaduensis (strain DSM 18323 / JCM 14033 / SH-6) TaxID=797210 RepID=F8D9N8_HALXS|nr:hypothetical protein [Halopiger xanaduensis]AEH37432.1 hypothetical protein Halxa_2816 [Halopiger xanaduensis SH-6]
MSPTPTTDCDRNPDRDRDRDRDRGSAESPGTLEAPAAPEIREPLATAREVLEREDRQLTVEQRAFERFQRRVAALETAAPRATAPTAGTGLGAGIGTGAAGAGGVGTGTTGTTLHSRPSEGLSQVRDAYVETVMSVPHYDDLYDDTWLESIAEEFSEEQAAALEQHAQLHPRLQRSLVTAAEQVVENRAQLRERVETEREAVDDADRELTDVCEDLQSLLEQPLAQLEFNALRLTRDRLESLRERCDDLATERQTALQRRRQEYVLGNAGTLEDYFYGDCEHTYPILAAIADLGAGIERGTAAVDRSLEQLLERESTAHPFGGSES